MWTIFQTKAYAPAAALAVLYCGAGPASADKLGVGNFDPPSMYQRQLPGALPRPTLCIPQEPEVKPLDEGDFEPTALPDIAGSPDTSAEMQKRWDSWHKRVADEIYVRAV